MNHQNGVSFKDGLKRAYPFERLSSFLPYDRFDSQTGLFFNQNGCGFVLETIPLVGCTEEMQREISSLFKYSLPEESFFQCLLWSDSNLTTFFEDWQTGRQKQSSDQSSILSEMASKRVAYLKNLSKNPNTGDASGCPQGSGFYLESV